MAGTAKARAARRKALVEEAVYVEMSRTIDRLSRGIAQVLKAKDLSSPQYNVLRSLRDASEGLSCGEIANRMITRDPDITRLLDRMEKRGLISRFRREQDRRTVMARITPEGLELVERLDEPIADAHRRQLGHLGRKRLRQLRKLLAQCRAEAA